MVALNRALRASDLSPSAALGQHPSVAFQVDLLLALGQRPSVAFQVDLLLALDQRPSVGPEEEQTCRLAEPLPE
tara:strand:- start:8 stop:229 length:222 start_codon:yes stop_codon:yes gene_type:complete